MKKAFIQT